MNQLLLYKNVYRSDGVNGALLNLPAGSPSAPHKCSRSKGPLRRFYSEIIVYQMKMLHTTADRFSVGFLLWAATGFHYTFIECDHLLNYWRGSPGFQSGSSLIFLIWHLYDRSVVLIGILLYTTVPQTEKHSPFQKYFYFEVFGHPVPESTSIN